MSKIFEAVDRITKAVGENWQGKRAEPSNDERIRSEVRNQLTAELPFGEVVILAAQEVEALARALSPCSDDAAVNSAVQAFGFPEIAALTGLATACNDAAHKIAVEQYTPLENKLSEVK